MKLFNLRIDTLLLRFYLMMLVVIIAGFTGVWSIAFLAFPIFMTCLMGTDLSLTRIRKSLKHPDGRIRAWIRNLRPPLHHTV